MISDDDFKFLLYQSRDAFKILEIGTGTGKSTAALRLNNSDVYTIDRNDIFEYNGLNVHKFICESKDYWKDHTHDGFDFVFVDGSITKLDCEEILKRTKDSFKIVFHDYMPNEDKDPGRNKGWYNMKVFKETALLNYAITEQLGGSHCGMLVLKKDK
jgi:predicted O-methyltransferase YrrM|tara:strand:- start:202 stop:672 length:471 start_codon:yes stop_codon:yes gene_type:complete